jgi:hypothetical protein
MIIRYYVTSQTLATVLGALETDIMRFPLFFPSYGLISLVLI